VTGFSFSGSDIYIFGALGVQTDIVQADNSSPRNVIDLYYQPLALRSIDFLNPHFVSAAFASARTASANTKSFVHPKFDGQLFKRKHRSIKSWVRPTRDEAQQH
jgi:hypothetical protein